MSWNERIKAAREAQKLTREQTVRKMRDYLPAGKTAAARTLVAWEQGDSEPKVTQAIALAQALGYHEVSELFSQADGPQLNRLGMDRLEEYRRLLLQSDEFREQPAVRRLRTLPVFLQPASPAPASGWTTIWLRRWRWTTPSRPGPSLACGWRATVCRRALRTGRSSGRARPNRPRTARSCCAC